MVMMEGILWKWTNYLSGWQPRWFILDYGVMSYYRSQDDVHLGSRGAVKMSCCEILINPSDQLRIDLKVPPENFIYLKASTPAERQKWVVALGTAKACIISSNLDEQKQQSHSMTFVKDKMKELLLCRGIMLEQISTIKATSHTTDENKIIEAVALLSATCDTFVSSLDDIMEIVEDNLNLFSDSPVSTPKLAKPSKQIVSSFRSLRSPSSISSYSDSLAESGGSHSSKVSLLSVTCSKSQDSDGSFGNLSPNGFSFDIDTAHYNTADNSDKNSSTLSVSSCTSSVKSGIGNELPVVSSAVLKSGIPNDLLKNFTDVTPESHQIIVAPLLITGKSIFGKAPVKFEDVQIGHHGLIPTKSFLEACRCILPVFDKLGSTTFAPVKMDIQGNIKKIDAKYNTDTAAFEFLQNIVFQEINSNEHNARNSATDALLWLKRALEFVCIFLAEVLQGERDLVVAAGTAYSKSLKKYHGWMVRGVFALALKACPYYDDFIASLSTNDHVSTNEEILQEMLCCVEGLTKIVSKLNHYYKKNKLDIDIIV